jgi:UDP-2,4-diacetamido-2,4,6-trideoxy-beta-L-altropyranose hydrolase
MIKPRILFRADASHELGFGHVARIAALIEECEAHHLEPVPLFGGDVVAVKAWTRDHDIAADIRDWSATAVAQAAEHPRVRAVVVDGPAIALPIMAKLPERVRPVLVDDAGRCSLALASVINHNIHAPSLAASYPAAKQRLLGRRYLMLRKDIRRHTRGSCRPASGARLRVVVTFGGSDPVGATVRMLHLVPPASERALELVVIAGPGFRDHDALRTAAAVATDAGHTIDIRCAPDDPGALFVSADAAIASAGGTLGELAYLGCPALAYAIAKDQVLPVRQQVREGLVAGGRNWEELDDNTLRSDLLAFLLDDAGRMAQRQRALGTADSDGVRRIIEEALA